MSFKLFFRQAPTVRLLGNIYTKLANICIVAEDWYLGKLTFVYLWSVPELLLRHENVRTIDWKPPEIILAQLY